MTLILKMNKLEAPVFAEGKLTAKAAADAVTAKIGAIGTDGVLTDLLA